MIPLVREDVGDDALITELASFDKSPTNGRRPILTSTCVISDTRDILRGFRPQVGEELKGLYHI